MAFRAKDRINLIGFQIMTLWLLDLFEVGLEIMAEDAAFTIDTKRVATMINWRRIALALKIGRLILSLKRCKPSNPETWLLRLNYLILLYLSFIRFSGILFFVDRVLSNLFNVSKAILILATLYVLMILRHFLVILKFLNMVINFFFNIIILPHKMFNFFSLKCFLYFFKFLLS